ncbi:MAG: hypothetical protein GY856_31335, partial [bacterium]|nr:hypothetical protein [bacterium]
MTDPPTSAAERHAELSESQLVSRLVELDTPALTAPLPPLKSELTAIAVGLEDLNRKVRQLTEKIALGSGQDFSGESADGHNGVRPHLLSEAVETLLALPTSSEDAAVR